MAGLFKNILDSLKLTEDDENEDYDEYVSELEEKERKKAERLEQKQGAKNEKKSFSQRNQEDYKTPTVNVNTTSTQGAASLAAARKERQDRSERASVSKVVPLRSPQKGLEVCIMKPTSFEDSQDICDMLLSGRAAVINLEGFDVDVAQRVMDFVSGAVYAMNGKLHQISSYIFIISPDNVDISGDYLDLIRQNGFEVPTFNKDF